FGDSGFMKNLDYGLGVGLGFEYARFSIYANYEHGLANLASDNLKTVFALTGNSDYSLKSQNFTIAIGYRIY
ncbi:MAG: hypothetical protein LBD28_06270, partial [Tannerellaceae bacterium]|nr:hypothetical protein [Tannerellaceae bacterium]